MMNHTYIEREEAKVFDRLAAKVDHSTLTLDAFTLLRYRSALTGLPYPQDRFPDLAVTAVGQHVQGSLSGIRMLDLGAGTGEWSALFTALGAKVTAVEVSGASVEVAQERMRRTGLMWDARVLSAYDMVGPLSPGSFDVIWGQAILHHLTHDLPRVYTQAAALLKPGGMAIFTEPYCGARVLGWVRRRLARWIPIDQETPDERPLMPREVQLAAEVFHRVQVCYFSLAEKVSQRLRPQLVPAAIALDRIVLRGPLRRLAGMICLRAYKNALTSR